MWNDSRAKAHGILRENWDQPKRGSSKWFLTNNRIHTTPRGTDIVLRRSSCPPIVRACVQLRIAPDSITWYLTTFDGDRSLENQTSQDICYIALSTSVRIESHYGQLVRKFIFILYSTRAHTDTSLSAVTRYYCTVLQCFSVAEVKNCLFTANLCRSPSLHTVSQKHIRRLPVSEEMFRFASSVRQLKTRHSDNKLRLRVWKRSAPL
jgi:hypothetical protein